MLIADMPSDPTDKVTLLEDIAHAWNKAEINYAVAHGIDGYPLRTGRDLDVLVQTDQIELALRLADAVLQKQAWRVASPPAIWGRRLIAVHASRQREMLEIHTLCALTWRNVTFADRPTPSQRIGPFKVDPWVSLTKRVIAPLLADNLRRFVARPEEFSATADELQAGEHRLPVLLGTHLTEALLVSIRNSDLESIRPLIGRLRWSAMLRSGFMHPIGSLALGWNSIRRKLLQPFSSCAPIIAIVGPDGVGKSTTLQAVQHSDGHIFLDIIVRHWRPGVLPRLAELTRSKIAQPGADGLLPPRRHPGRFQAFRLFYYYLDFLIGGLCKDRIASSRQCLVLYDRCFLDMAVDPLRFGLASSRGTELCWRWLPKPDRIIFLSDEPGRIHARKPELTELEIQRHLDEWRRRVKMGQIHTVIAVQASRDEVTDRIWEVIADAFVEKNGGFPDRPVAGRDGTAPERSGGSDSRL